MNPVYSHLLGREVDSSSEEHRHECECRWLLANKPTRTEKHMYVYGVRDREMVVVRQPGTGKDVLRDDASRLWPERVKPLVHWRGLDGADRIMADARRLYELNAQQAATTS